MTPQVRLELEQLLSALCDGALTEPEHARLDALLSADADCRRHYLEYVDLHANLLAAPGLPAGDFASTPIPAQTPRSARRWRHLAPYLTLVAATLVLSLLLQVLWSKRTNHQRSDGADGATTTLATLAQAVDCDWEGPGRPFKAGARLGQEELRLRKGLVRLRFDSGSELLIQGPAVVRVDGAAEATVRSGKVVFRADDTGPPFELHTPTATLVDVGTEYGVEVNGKVEEVHVFNGEVRRTPQGGGAVERLGPGDARLYDAVAPVQPTPLDESKFVRKMPGPERPDPDAGLLAHEDFNYDDPDALTKGWGSGGRGWAGPWRAAPPFFRPGQKPTPRPSAINPTEGLSHLGEVGAGGCFEYTGFATFSRRLITPIRLDEEATYYFSFLFRRDKPAPGEFSTFNVSIKAADEARFDPQWFNRRISFGIGGENNHLCTSHQGAANRVPLPLGFGKTYLLVAKIVAYSSRPTEVYVRVYGPDEPVEHEETMLWTATGRPVRSDLTLSWIEIHVNSRRRQQIDEIRLGTTWASVTGPSTAP